MRPSKRRPGRLRKTRSALCVTAVPSSSVPGVVRLQQVVGLAPGLAGQGAQALAVALDEDLVRVQEHEPVARGGVEGDVAGVAERAGPLEVDELGAELERDLPRAVLRAGVDDDELVDGVADGGEAAREHLLLVLDDHAQAQREALGRARGGGDALAARGQVAHRGADGGRERRRLQARAAAGLELVEVVRHVREIRVQPARGLEEALGRAQLAELVEGDARDVQEAGLARLGLEQLDGAARDDGHRAGEDGQVGGRLVQTDLEECQPGLVAAVDVLDVVGAREERGVRVDVARGQCGARLEAELGACRARLRGQGDGVRSRCCCEFRRSGRQTKSHGGRTSEEGMGHARVVGRNRPRLSGSSPDAPQTQHVFDGYQGIWAKPR